MQPSISTVTIDSLQTYNISQCHVLTELYKFSNQWYKSHWGKEKMTYKFTIDGRLDGQNDFIKANRTHPKAGNNMKQDNQQVAMWAIRQQLKRLKIEKPIHIHYKFIEKNRRRDKDNIASFAIKVIQDALVQVEVIKNDGWKEVDSFNCTFGVDKDNPRIEVIITEVGD